MYAVGAVNEGEARILRRGETKKLSKTCEKLGKPWKSWVKGQDEGQGRDKLHAFL